MLVAQVSQPNTPFDLVEREIPEPANNEVRVRVHACGICHSDAAVKEGAWPGLKFPRVPGHEVAGVIDAVGPRVSIWTIGQRVGIGWHGGYCGRCEACRHGNFFACVWGRITGITYDGGYAEYIIAHETSLALLPDELSFVEAGPLVCAGVTTFNALRNSGARAGDLVAVLGLGGLGHLGVQFAVRMGFRTVAIARGDDKEPLARQLGAHAYLNSHTVDVAAELNRMGGAKVILATVTNAEAMSATIAGLGVDGTLLVLGAPHEPLSVPAGLLIRGRGAVAGWYSGVSMDSQETLAFSELSGVRAMTEVFPLQQPNEAYERMMSGKARFRVVLSME
jgi:D-arabinose 1-dehydrogenase-like Zn-dependent alcohol dehydrogenase